MTTGVDGSRTISITGPLSRSADDFGTPVDGGFSPVLVRATTGTDGSSVGMRTTFVGWIFTGCVSACALHSLLQNATTLPSRTLTAGARNGSTGLPHTGQGVMEMRVPLPLRTARSMHR